jgi:hypothetical protein
MTNNILTNYIFKESCVANVYSTSAAKSSDKVWLIVVDGGRSYRKDGEQSNFLYSLYYVIDSLSLLRFTNWALAQILS